jgi:hypothetical protein
MVCTVFDIIDNIAVLRHISPVLLFVHVVAIKNGTFKFYTLYHTK